jgi:LL-diaminopimelate aminotransferase
LRFSKRVENLPPYLFVNISQKIAQKRANGEEVISFAIGDPDIPTPDYIIEELIRAAKNPVNHQYPESDGLPEFKRAVANWYSQRFNVSLDASREVVSLIGAKEGIAHIALCLIDEGDIALITDPGYPVYTFGTKLCGGIPYYLPIEASNNYLPDLETIPSDIVRKAKVLWLNYPNNPTGATANLEYFNKVVKFAKSHDIAVCHDGPYTEVAYDGYRPVSFLQAEGAKEVGIEFHSLSKSYNMAGWRIGMAVGNPFIIDALRRMKSNIDSGIPRSIQRMAIAALTGPQDCIIEHNVIYQKRRDKLVKVLNDIGLACEAPLGSLYIWAKCPEGYSSAGLAEELLEKWCIVITPGVGYGVHGEGYVRLSLTLPDIQLEKGLHKLIEWKGSKQ